MCGIAGFSDFSLNYTATPDKWTSILEEMNRIQKHRGPDDDGTYLTTHCGLSHVRLSIIDLSTGHQPMTRAIGKGSCTIVYNGEIYNMQELRKELQSKGMQFQTTSDTEVILAGYQMYGTEIVKKLNGIFAFAIWDERKQRLYLFRDQIGRAHV